MITASTKELMLTLLDNYQGLIINQLVDHALVGEYLTDRSLGDVRLLCQLRSIIFLCKTTNELNLQNVVLAERLYIETELHYFDESKWLQKLNSIEEATLYSYAFVILAQSYLYQVTKNPLYSIALAETFSLIEGKFQEQDLFKPLSDLACLEQNSAMHLYEALTFAFYQTNALYMKQAITDLEQQIIETFWQQNSYLLAEKVDYSGNVLSYEAGHWFEWVSLLWRVKQWGGSSFIDPAKLYESAVTHTTFTEQQLVLNELNSELVAQYPQQIRIWPNLEYLRASHFMGQLTDKAINSFMQLFFDQQGLPLEYLNTDMQKVKSTTGYHIAESFIDMLTSQ